ncbi:MAG: response regulator [Pseudomonadota bacterium]
MGSKTRVLIVDDEERFRSTMQKLLTIRGFETATAGSGQEALEELDRNNSYDVVILDVRMPDMTGVQVLPAIKKRDPHMEVIIMTGYASVDTAKEILKQGAYDYMLKPYSIEELVDKIEAARDRRKARLDATRTDD